VSTPHPLGAYGAAPPAPSFFERNRFAIGLLTGAAFVLWLYPPFYELRQPAPLPRKRKRIRKRRSSLA
jgi:hypothetical protein